MECGSSAAALCGSRVPGKGADESAHSKAFGVRFGTTARSAMECGSSAAALCGSRVPGKGADESAHSRAFGVR